MGERLSTILQTERLVIRPFHMSDVPALHVFLSDPVATQYWADPHKEIAETEAFVKGTMEADPAICRDFILEQDGQVIGKAGCWQAPEVGFFLLPPFQSQGYMREALDTVLPYLFIEMSPPCGCLQVWVSQKHTEPRTPFKYKENGVTVFILH